MTPARAAELADGRVHIGAEAVRLGLADGVAAWGDFVRAFVAQVTPPPTKADHVAAWETAVMRRMQAGGPEPERSRRRRPATPSCTPTTWQNSTRGNVPWREIDRPDDTRTKHMETIGMLRPPSESRSTSRTGKNCSPRPSQSCSTMPRLKSL